MGLAMQGTPQTVPPVLTGFLTWLNAVDDRWVGGLAWAFHLAIQPAAMCLEQSV